MTRREASLEVITCADRAMAWRESSLEVKKLCCHVSLDVVVIICAVGEDQKNVGIDWSRLSCAARHLQFACLSVVPSFSPPFASATKPLLARGRSIGHICLTLYLAAL